MNLPDKWFDNLAFSAMAAFAGLLGYLMRSANDRRAVTWKRSLLEAASSGFIGFLTVMVCRATGVPYEWMGFIAGVLGWLGATASIQLFERIVRRKLGIENVDYTQGVGEQHRSRDIPSDVDRGTTGGS